MICAFTGAVVKKPTAFATRVYTLVKQIPRGKVASYGAVADALGTCARAVGTAMRRNPYKAVPWHRVVAASRWLGGFGGQWGDDTPNVRKKRRMLEAEGVAFEQAGGRVALRSMHTFGDGAAAKPAKPKATKAATKKRKRKK